MVCTLVSGQAPIYKGRKTLQIITSTARQGGALVDCNPVPSLPCAPPRKGSDPESFWGRRSRSAAADGTRDHESFREPGPRVAGMRPNRKNPYLHFTSYSGMNLSHSWITEPKPSPTSSNRSSFCRRRNNRRPKENAIRFGRFNGETERPSNILTVHIQMRKSGRRKEDGKMPQLISKNRST